MHKQETHKARVTVALMRGFRTFHHTEKVGEVMGSATSSSRGGHSPESVATQSVGRVPSEAPRLETPCHVESGTVESRNATRPCGDKSRRPLWGVARPWQPRHREPCHACSRALPQIQNVCCATGVCEGRNTVLRRGRCQVRWVRPFWISPAFQRGMRKRQEDRGCTPSRQQ